MRTRITKGITAVAAVLAASTAVFLGNTGGSAAAAAPGLPAFGLIQGTTMCYFSTDRPATLNWVMDVTGLTGSDTRLVGIDFRVQDGLLYGVGNYGGVYTIPTVPPPGATVLPIKKVSQLTVALYGTNFDIDFNPAADRLRIISDNGQNLRHDLNTHTTIEDLPLSNNGSPAKGVTGAAYTNNDLNADTATTLFDLDTVNDQVVIQAPPNNGTLNPTGKLTVDFGADSGFDVFADLVGGKTVSNTAFAATMPGGGARASLYTVELLTGTATKVGDFPSIAPVTDVAVALDTN